MNPKPIEQAKDPVFAGALPALRRARQRAIELAAATDTAIVDWVDGKSSLGTPVAASSHRAASR